MKQEGTDWCKHSQRLTMRNIEAQIGKERKDSHPIIETNNERH